MAAFNMSKAIVGGRLTRDPELKTTQSGVPVCSFTVAINRRGKDGNEPQADFIDCVAWRQTAEFITRYFRRASSICVVGTLQTRKWEDRDGNKRSMTEVVADEAYFVDAKNEMPGQKEDPTAHAPSYIPEAYLRPSEKAVPNYEDISESDELPF